MTLPQVVLYYCLTGRLEIGKPFPLPHTLLGPVIPTAEGRRAAASLYSALLGREVRPEDVTVADWLIGPGETPAELYPFVPPRGEPNSSEGVRREPPESEVV